MPNCLAHQAEHTHSRNLGCLPKPPRLKVPTPWNPNLGTISPGALPDHALAPQCMGRGIAQVTRPDAEGRGLETKTLASWIALSGGGHTEPAQVPAPGGLVALTFWLTSVVSRVLALKRKENTLGRFISSLVMLSSSQSLPLGVLNLGLFFFSHWLLFRVSDPLLQVALNSPVCLGGSTVQLLLNLEQSNIGKAYPSGAFIKPGDTRGTLDFCIREKEGHDV